MLHDDAQRLSFLFGIDSNALVMRTLATHVFTIRPTAVLLRVIDCFICVLRWRQQQKGTIKERRSYIENGQNFEGNSAEVAWPTVHMSSHTAYIQVLFLFFSLILRCEHTVHFEEHILPAVHRSIYINIYYI